jgi:hypothetical protein
MGERGGARPGSRLERFLGYVAHNIDAVVGITVALAAAVLDMVSGLLPSSVTTAAILVVLASLAYGSLAERSHRMDDMREATRGAERALADLAMVRELHRGDMAAALEAARQNTERWHFKGGTGTYLRAVTLPRCVEAARRHRRSLTVRIDIVDPTHVAACEAYARFRENYLPQEPWSPERTRKEAYATVLAGCWYQQRLDTLEIGVRLSAAAPALRYDMSSSCLIITQDDPDKVHLRVEHDRPLYQLYASELHRYYEQGRDVPLRDAPRLTDEPTVDEARRLFDAVGLPLPTEFGDADVAQIVDKALRPPIPYER